MGTTSSTSSERVVRIEETNVSQDDTKRTEEKPKDTCGSVFNLETQSNNTNTKTGSLTSEQLFTINDPVKITFTIVKGSGEHKNQQCTSLSSSTIGVAANEEIADHVYDGKPQTSSSDQSIIINDSIKIIITVVKGTGEDKSSAQTLSSSPSPWEKTNTTTVISAEEKKELQPSISSSTSISTERKDTSLSGTPLQPLRESGSQQQLPARQFQQQGGLQHDRSQQQSSGQSQQHSQESGSQQQSGGQYQQRLHEGGSQQHSQQGGSQQHSQQGGSKQQPGGQYQQQGALQGQIDGQYQQQGGQSQQQPYQGESQQQPSGQHPHQGGLQQQSGGQQQPIEYHEPQLGVIGHPAQEKTLIQQQNNDIRRLLQFHHIDDGDLIEVHDGPMQRLILVHPERSLPHYIQADRQILHQLETAGDDLLLSSSSSQPFLSNSGSNVTNKIGKESSGGGQSKFSLEEAVSHGEAQTGPIRPFIQVPPENYQASSNVRQVYPPLDKAYQQEQQKQTQRQVSQQVPTIQSSSSSASTSSSEENETQQKQSPRQEKEKTVVHSVMKQVTPLVEEYVTTEIRRVLSGQYDNDDDDNVFIPFPIMFGGEPIFNGPSCGPQQQETNPVENVNFTQLLNGLLFTPPDILITLMKDLTREGVRNEMPSYPSTVTPPRGPSAALEEMEERYGV